MPLLRYALVGVFAAFIFVPTNAGEYTNTQLHQRICHDHTRKYPNLVSNIFTGNFSNIALHSLPTVP